MELEKVIDKKVKSMSVRILATLENILACHLDSLSDNDSFNLDAVELRTLRSEILNAYGDTARSIKTILKDPESVQGKVSLSRDVIAALRDCEFYMIEEDGPEGPNPVLDISSHNTDTLVKIRDLIGAGVVYNKSYYCIDFEDCLNRAIPVLDKVRVTGINLGSNSEMSYKDWRDAICRIYLGEVTDG